MLKSLIAAILAGSLALPSLAQAQNTRIPIVRIPATVTGTWVLDPLACPDIREDIRDSRITTSRADRREDRRDRRLIDCPPSAYRFIPNPGQAPNRPIRTYRGGGAAFVGAGQPPYVAPPAYQPPTYGQPQPYQATPQPQPYQAPTYTQPSYTQPNYTQPSYNAQPTYIPTTPTYQ